MPRYLTEQDIADFRAELCKVATERFARYGYEGVTMRQLAEALGCSPKTPYRYFKDKADILATVRAQAFAKFADALEKAAAGVNGRGRARPADQRGLSRLRAQEPARLSHHVRARRAGRRKPSRARTAGRARGALHHARCRGDGGGGRHRRRSHAVRLVDVGGASTALSCSTSRAC